MSVKGDWDRTKDHRAFREGWERTFGGPPRAAIAHIDEERGIIAADPAPGQCDDPGCPCSGGGAWPDGGPEAALTDITAPE